MKMVDENTNFLSFADFWDTSEYAKAAMEWAIERGILTGDATGALRPQGEATRAEAATMMMRFCEAALNQ